MEECYDLKKFADLLVNAQRLRSRDTSASLDSHVYWKIHRCWVTVLLKYTLCSLSFNNDKLAAIEGLVDQMAKATGGQYLAGLWKDQIHTNLLWRRFALENARSRPARAPTWSWASLDGPVLLPDPLSSDDTAVLIGKLLSSSVTPSDGNGPSDIICQGELRFSTILYSITHYISDSARQYPKNPGHRIFEVEVQGRMIKGDAEFDDPQDDEGLSTDISCMPLIIDRDEEDDSTLTMGIVLRSVNSRKNIYERVGCFDISATQGEFQELYNHWGSNQNANEETLVDSLVDLVII